ncbi:MAG: GNAT family N-acetyltransferase [Hyphomonadaceae bacterium]
MAAAPVLETLRLRLREWRENDLDALAAMLGEPESNRWTTLDGRPSDRISAWRTLMQMAGQWRLQGFGMFLIEERETGAFVGRAGAWSPEPGGALELGWGLSRMHWGKGYATEAARAAGDWTLARFQPKRFVSRIHAENMRSQNVARRLGERPETPTYHIGQPHVIWAVEAADWRASALRA